MNRPKPVKLVPDAALQAKLAKNRAMGQRKGADLEATIVAEYAADPDVGYRALAAKHGIGLGTVMRIIRRAGQGREPSMTADPFVRSSEFRQLLQEALELLDTRTGKRRALGERIRKALES